MTARTPEGALIRRIRLMTWNVRSLRDDRSAVVAVLRRCAPDVVLVQEVPRFLRVRSRLAALARESDLVVASGGAPAAGVAILTSLRIAVHEHRQVELPRTRGLHRRGISVAELSFGDTRFSAASVHLGLDHAERLRHVAAIKDLLGDEAGVPVVVGGDLNEVAGDPAWSLLGEGVRDVGALGDLATFPAIAPRRRIDALFMPLDWAAQLVSPTEMVDDALLIRATDHRPVIVDVVD
jgi:endonuclease/exonuclease/phosphatase family metal-dependent hydrolase